MSTQNVSCSANTYVSRYSRNVNHSSASKLLTAKQNSDGIGSTSYQNALLQFAIPQAVWFKKITKVVLTYYVGSDMYPDIPLSKVYYTPYITENSVEGVTYSNVAVLGTIGERKEVTRLDTHAKWISEDVTDIFTNNVTKDGLFSVFISTGNYTENDYISPYGVISYIGGKNGNAAYLTVTYEDVDQLPPTISYPDGVYIREGEKVLFSWVYNSATLATQSSVSLEWRAKGASTWNVISLTQKAQYYECDPVFPQGTIEWRIKVTNNVGESSTYTYASFEVIGKPSVPIITNIQNKALTTIEWNASDQCAYEITLAAGEKEILHELVCSGDPKYKPNMSLENGSYTVKLRTRNSIDLWSDETSKTFSINAAKPEVPGISLRQDGSNIIIEFTHETGTSVAIIRNDKVIAVVPQDVTQYVDCTAQSGKEYTYKVRAYAEGFSDSQSRSGMVRYDGFILSGNGEEINGNSSEDKFLTYSESRSKERALMQYVGREYPVLETGEFKSQKIVRKVYITESQYDSIARMHDGNIAVHYKDERNSFACVISGLAVKRYMNVGYIVEIEVTRLNEDEVILNE